MSDETTRKTASQQPTQRVTIDDRLLWHRVVYAQRPVNEYELGTQVQGVYRADHCHLVRQTDAPHIDFSHRRPTNSPGERADTYSFGQSLSIIGK